MAVVTKASKTRSAQAGKPPYQRTQILLEPAQHAALKEQSERESRSISEIVREMVQAGLDESDSRHRQQLAVVERLVELRQEAKAKYGVYEGEDPIEAVRRKRAEQQDRVLRGLE